jgi:nucleotide-binding universal stress UspA family protein
METSRQDIRHVLLATDHRSASDAATDEAIRAAADQRAVLLVLSVIPRIRVPEILGTRRYRREHRRREVAARTVLARAMTAGVQAVSLIWPGDPAAAILDVAATERADLVVLGTRPLHGLRRRLSSSVSTRVASAAGCDVVVVRQHAAPMTR